jgi:hypothetical protein
MPNDVRDEIYPVHHQSLYSLSDGFTAHYQLGKRCYNTFLLDVAGHASTGGDGKKKFKLGESFCKKGVMRFGNPVNFVATPYTPGKDIPTYLTITQKKITSDIEDIEITVNSWDKSGSPLGNISFNWRCVVSYSPVG